MRIAAGLTQAELAQKALTSKSMISLVERGLREGSDLWWWSINLAVANHVSETMHAEDVAEANAQKLAQKHVNA